jgi:anti-sigma factor RsiW
MNCQEFQDVLFEWMDKDLPPAADNEAEAHLRGCPACRTRVERQRTIALTLGQEMLVVARETRFSPALERRILDVASSSPESRWQKVTRLMDFYGAVAAAACLLFIFSWWWYQQGRATLMNVVVHDSVRKPWARPLSIENALCTPGYVFEWRGDTVVDSIECRALVIERQIQLSAVENDQFK